MGQLDVSVIVPTYREADNLPLLVPRVAAALEKAGLRGEIVVVDDNSPDATVSVCAELADLLSTSFGGPQDGAGPFQCRGSRDASGGRPSLGGHGRGPVASAGEGAGAGGIHRGRGRFRHRQPLRGRRRHGGGLGPVRWLNSKAATLLAWPLTRAKDPMAGFFALRRSTFESARNLDPIGYKIGLEFLVKCRCQDVREVPIAFANRVYGESKLTLKEQLNYLRHLKRLYDFKLGRLAKPLEFGLVGASGVVVDLAAFTLLLQASADGRGPCPGHLDRHDDQLLPESHRDLCRRPLPLDGRSVSLVRTFLPGRRLGELGCDPLVDRDHLVLCRPSYCRPPWSASSWAPC